MSDIKMEGAPPASSRCLSTVRMKCLTVRRRQDKRQTFGSDQKKNQL